MAAVDLSTVHHVYSGRAGKCACGCSGTHRYLAAYREESGLARGYALDDEDVNDRQVAKICNLLRATHAADPELVHDEGDHVWAEVNDRIYVAYRRSQLDRQLSLVD